MRDIIVGDMAAFDVATLSGATGEGLVVRVVVVGFGVFKDYVPGVEKAGDVAQTAEGEVDDRVGGADSYFDPY